MGVNIVWQVIDRAKHTVGVTMIMGNLESKRTMSIVSMGRKKLTLIQPYSKLISFPLEILIQFSWIEIKDRFLYVVSTVKVNLDFLTLSK